jgi:hypothetical protein
MSLSRLLIVATVSFVIGIGTGIYLTRYAAQQAATVAMVQQLVEFGQMNDRLKAAATGGDPVEYESALWAQLHVLEHLRNAKHPWVGGDRTYFGDRSMTYTRLAFIAEQQSQTAKAESLMRRAIDECQKSGRGACSAAELRAFVKQVDANWLAK